MTELVILGTAASVPDADHDTVSMVLHGPKWAVLIDCGGSPLYKLARTGVHLHDIQAVILTHRHADHVYGLPMLVQGLWLAGRESRLPLYGPPETISLARELLQLFHLDEREGMFRLDWRPIPLQTDRQVLQIGAVEIRSTPVVHGNVQTVALRLEDSATRRAIVYSADTEPCPDLVRFATGANLLIHEATGDYPGHSSPAEAGRIAQDAEVKELALIHYPVHGIDLEDWRQAALEFRGRVTLAQDGDVYAL
jgi:ribonuclease Z